MDTAKLQYLKTAMEELSEAREELGSQKKAFEEKTEPLRDRIAEIQKDIDEVKEKISAEAIAEYKNDPEKKKQLAGGIGIRQGKDKKVYKYKPADALSFAKTKGMFLNLDKKSFEAAIPSFINDVDFIETDTLTGEISATFPKEITL